MKNDHAVCRTAGWIIALTIMLSCAFPLSVKAGEYDTNQIHLYTQWDEDRFDQNHTESKWWGVYYEHGAGSYEGQSTNLYLSGCGIFALSHITQALGLERKDTYELLPAKYAAKLSGHCTCCVAGEGIGIICRSYGLGYAYHDALSSNQIVNMLSTSKSALILHPPGHWTAAIALSNDKQYVLIADSCIYPYKTSGRDAYKYDSGVFSKITDWSEVTRASSNSGTGYGDGIMDGGAFYWIKVEDAAAISVSSFSITYDLPDPPEYSLSLTPDTIDLGTLYFGYSRALAMEASKVLTLKNTGNQTLVLDPTMKPPSFCFENYSKTVLEPGEEATVAIVPAMMLEPRVHDFSVYVCASNKAGIGCAGMTLELKLEVKNNPILQGAVRCPYCQGTNLKIDNGVYDPYYELIEGEWSCNEDGTHSGMAVHVNWVYCNDCDDHSKRFSVPIAEPAMYTGKHVYDQGACNVCGHVIKQCPHEMNTLRLVDSEFINYTPRYRDEQFHFQPYTSITYYECPECGEAYSESWEMESVYAHSFDADGKCACGATGEPTTCEHARMDLRADEVNVRYREIKEFTHTRIADVYCNAWCPACQTSRQYNLWYTTRDTEAHEYANGQCVCGKRESMEAVRSYSLPGNTRTIGEEAFSGTPVQQVVVNDGCQKISARAFAYCADLVRIVLPASIHEIAEDAFLDCSSLTIWAPSESYAMEFAQAQGIPFSVLE